MPGALTKIFKRKEASMKICFVKEQEFCVSHPAFEAKGLYGLFDMKIREISRLRLPAGNSYQCIINTSIFHPFHHIL